jgi:hypothetical protein
LLGLPFAAHSGSRMSWRKWFVRSLVFSIAAAAGCAVYWYEYWTNPSAVRQQVIAKLQSYFPGAIVTLESAHLQLLGGIALRDLRLTRRDEATGVEFLHVPSAVIYHDKEKLLDGVLDIRKVEMVRPRLRIARSASGTWNLAGITGPIRPDRPVPTVVIKQGTFVFEDHLNNSELAGLEITHVNMNLINDPLPAIQLDGRAHSRIAGDVEIHGNFNRASHDVTLSAQVQGLPVTRDLLRRLAMSCPNLRAAGLDLEGKADLKADLVFAPGAEREFSYDVRCRLTQGRLRHPKIPLPLDNMNAYCRCTNGQLHLENLHAESGKSEVTARGIALLPCPEKHFDGFLEIKHLQLGNELFARVPDLQVIHDFFRPEGPAMLRVVCARRESRWTQVAPGKPSTVSLIPENMRVEFKKFPYPLERLTGALDYNLLTTQLAVNVTGYSGPRPVLIKGHWRGKGVHADGVIAIQATGIPLDEKLLRALSPYPAYARLARSFRATGKGDIQASIRHVPDQPYDNDYHCRFHDATINWEHFPYPLTGVSGNLDIYPGHWEFHDFQGKHGAGVVWVKGKTARTGDTGPENDLIIEIGGQNIAFDDDLRKALAPHPSLGKTWDTFAPSGRMSVAAVIHRPLMAVGPDAEAEILRKMDVLVGVRGFTVEPCFFPYALSDVTGGFRYHGNKVDFKNLSARHGMTEVKIEHGTVDLLGEGGFYAKINQVTASELASDVDLIKALPASLRETARALDVKHPMALKTDLIVSQAPEPGSQPDIYWDGQISMQKGRLRTGLELTDVTGVVACRGRHGHNADGRQLLAMNGNFHLDQATMLQQPFHDVVGNFQVQDTSPEVFALSLKAPLFGGDISGQVRLEFNTALRYEMNLTASQIDLQQFGRHNLGLKPELKGLAVGRLYLTGQGSGIDTLDGNGHLEMPRGHIYNLPLLLDLLKFLGLRWPDRTMFDEAKADFSLRGPKVHVARLDLLGNAISLYGKGDFNLDGTDLKLDFYPSWGRIEQMVPPAFRAIPAEIGKQMLKIEMRGRVAGNPGDLRFTKRPLPGIVDPFLYVRDKMAGTK